MEANKNMRISVSEIIRAKLSGAVALVGSGALFVIVFIIDAVKKNLEIDLGLVGQFRSLFLLVAFFGTYLFIRSLLPKKRTNPLRLFGLTLVTVLSFLSVVLVVSLISVNGFEAIEMQLNPVDYITILFSSVISIVTGVAFIILLTVIAELIFIKRRKGTKRNFIIFLVLLLASALSTWNLEALQTSTTSYVLFIITVFVGIANSFKFSWIVYLTKREKLYSIGYGFLLFVLLIIVNISLTESGFINRSLLYYSYPLQFFIRIVAIFSVIYFGMSFIVSLFHLPTAEAFDRKRIELSSLHNLSRLITRVFNFNDLVQTVTNLTIEVTEARSAWLEIQRADAESEHESRFEVVAHKNIDPAEIKMITDDETGLRRHIIETKRVVVIDEFSGDRRTRNLSRSVKNIGSMIGVPLVSQDQMIGILYAAKNIEFGFDQEDTDLIATFADHVTIAIENSRLIEESIERERLQQELMVAQKVQKKLLPQQLPVLEKFDLDAFSSPAFEVGGDYFDIVSLDDERLGIVVGDVSGKGVSAAFYMAELKGIFQALSKSCRSAREFLIRANNALYGSIEKSAFISLIYAIIDLRQSTVQLSRAGHCPMIHVQNGAARLHRPTGIGLGLTGAALFDDVIEEETVRLEVGDICAFYTDGITEARNTAGEEYGSDRLIHLIRANKTLSTRRLRELILEDVSTFIENRSFDDDLTIVILKRNSD
jgi:phosphoserine phosphatase RsbU/P